VGVTYWIFAWRVVLGVAVGADFPIAAAIIAERARLKRRGAVLSLSYALHGVGGLLAAAITAIVVACYHGKSAALNSPHNLANPTVALSISGAWRILQGLVIPLALGLLFVRLALPESTMFVQARKLQDEPGLVLQAESNVNQEPLPEGEKGEESSRDENRLRSTALGFKAIGHRAHFQESIKYFREWSHLKILLGTSGTWFLHALSSFGITLVLPDLLAALKITSRRPYDAIFKLILGNLVVNVAGFLPGFYLCIGLVEVVGRKPIGILGFLMSGVLLIVMGVFHHPPLHRPAPIFVLFSFIQFFNSFGPLSTTFIVAAEAFPTRVRATASGFSGACGRLGTVTASIGFYQLSKAIGTNKVLQILGTASLLGIPFALLTPETRLRDPDVLDRRGLAESARWRAEESNA
jgi:MFS transporter, PHS family, inorganic phosphate transporter